MDCGGAYGSHEWATVAARSGMPVKECARCGLVDPAYSRLARACVAALRKAGLLLLLR